MLHNVDKTKLLDELVELYETYGGSLGYTDEESVEDQDVFEDRLRALICKYRGHVLEPDHCGKPEHDMCEICRGRRGALEGDVRDFRAVTEGDGVGRAT